MSQLSALIVEDEIYLADFFAIVLQKMDFAIEICNFGRVASTLLSLSRPDLVLLDIHLPDVSGIDLITQIRADNHLTQTQVVIITADILLPESIKQKADLVIFKPVTFQQLRDEISLLCCRVEG